MISLNYDPFATTFSESRRDLKWQELEYFFNKYSYISFLSVLDVGCGNGRLLGVMRDNNIEYGRYLGVDSSEKMLEEASLNYPLVRFFPLEMSELERVDETFDVIFFIASFHHLRTINDRIEVLKKARKLLNDGGFIFMTNWSLESEINYMKYIDSAISDSENEYGSKDFGVKIGEYKRFYHSFTIEELEYIFGVTGFEVLENREFDNKKNFISVLRK